MKKNIGTIDRIVRVVIGIVLIILFVLNVTDSWFDYILGIFGLALLITSVIGYCCLYSILGFTTCEQSKDNTTNNQ